MKSFYFPVFGTLEPRALFLAYCNFLMCALDVPWDLHPGPLPRSNL